jgi:hypothetical protein
MRKCLYILLPFCIIFVACEKEIVNKSVFTLYEVTRTEQGATFQGKISIMDDVSYDDYGFVWSDRKDPTMADSVYFIGRAPVEGNFMAEIRNDLVPGTIYHVRAFLKAKNAVFYSNTVKFESLGSASPMIMGFSPDHGGARDTVRISGANFSRIVSNMHVQIGTAECEILESSREELRIRIPTSYFAGSFPVKVNVSGKTAESKDALHWMAHLFKVFPQPLDPEAL